MLKTQLSLFLITNGKIIIATQFEHVNNNTKYVYKTFETLVF